MSTHTPAPWRLEGVRGRTVLGPDGKQIAEARLSLDRDPNEATANARLITAAPALFAAAQAAAVNALDIDGSDRVSISREHLHDLYAALRIAEPSR